MGTEPEAPGPIWPARAVPRGSRQGGAGSGASAPPVAHPAVLRTAAAVHPFARGSGRCSPDTLSQRRTSRDRPEREGETDDDDEDRRKESRRGAEEGGVACCVGGDRARPVHRRCRPSDRKQRARGRRHPAAPPGTIGWTGAGNDTLWGLAGDDALVGGLGRDLLIGASGKDRLFGSPDADILDAGSGADRLNGGSGSDSLSGGSGPNNLFAYDGQKDVVACGPGRDFASVDELDEVKADCEEIGVAIP
ncbi:MAG: hypothetical protein M3Q60_16735 [Actinomycetota bacterium]|nr:hypothetical protein [Actinomycetota bacterium]